MNTPNRKNGRASLPFTPASTPSASRGRIDSFAEPKSELLRHALDAKRAAHSSPTPTPTPTPAPTESRQTPLEKSKDTVSDPWLDNAKEDEDAVKVTPVRRSRRPSEGPTPRMRTQRELQAENDGLKNAQMDLKIRLEALQSQHNKLLDQAEEDRARIQELESYEEEVFDLRDTNAKHVSTVRDMEDELTELRSQNEEILKISEDTVAEIENKEEALQEAAEIILGLEKDKADLLEEIERLKETQRTKSQAAAGYDTNAFAAVHENLKYPADLTSVDDSRPSTGYHDSDYYSMPASPRETRSPESMIFVSERAKKFINLKKEAQQSIKDLSRRLSNASLKQDKKKNDPVPKVPQIPEAFKRQPASADSLRTPKRSEPPRVSLSPALSYDPYAMVPDRSSSPQTSSSGLRHQLQKGLSLDTSHYQPASRLSSSTSTPTSNKRSKQSLRSSDAPTAPTRHSSRAAMAAYSAEQLKSEAASQLETHSEAGTETTWEVPSSAVSEAATTEVDANYRGPWYNQISSWGTMGRSFMPGQGKKPAQRATSYTEKNFLFNPTENEDDFVEKTRSLGRRQR